MRLQLTITTEELAMQSKGTVFYDAKGKESRKDYDVELVRLTLAICNNPSDATAYLNRSVLHYNAFKQNNQASFLKKALDDCNEALNIKPQFRSALYNRALIHLHAKNKAAARTDCQTLLAIDKRHSSTLHLYGSILLDDGLYSDAIKAFKKAIACSSVVESQFYFSLGAAYYHQADIDNGLKNLLKGCTLNIDPTLAENLFYFLNKFDKDEILNAIESFPDIDDQITLFENCLNETHPLKKRLLHNSWFSSSLTKAEKKLKELKAIRARQLEDDKDMLPSEFLDRGNKHLSSGKLTSALADFDSVLQNEPHNLEALHKKGNILFYQGKLQLARKQYEAVLNINPEHSIVHNNLALLIIAEKDFTAEALNKALEHCKLSLDRDPNNLNACHTLIEIYSYMNISAEAVIAALSLKMNSHPGAAAPSFALGKFCANHKLTVPFIQNMIFTTQRAKKDEDIYKSAISLLERQSKDDILLAITALPKENEVKLSLLLECLDQATILGKRFWLQEGFKKCRYNKGHLKTIIGHILELNPDYTPPQEYYVKSKALPLSNMFKTGRENETLDPTPKSSTTNDTYQRLGDL